MLPESECDTESTEHVSCNLSMDTKHQIFSTEYALAVTQDSFIKELDVWIAFLLNCKPGQHVNGT